jgi:hypothetical protein
VVCNRILNFLTEHGIHGWAATARCHTIIMYVFDLDVVF